MSTEVHNPEQATLCCPHPDLEWRGTIDNAYVECTSCGFILSDDGHLTDWHDPEEIKNWQDHLIEEGEST